MTKLDELLAQARAATAPALVPDSKSELGGVDPLGLRQLNFDLMDRVFPGLNNVARQIRPFVIVAWAWRRVWQIVEESGHQHPREEVLDFVDRIETIFVWSQFLRDPQSDLPGRQALASMVSAESFRFGGDDWKKLRDRRRTSTGLMAAVNYGPGLRGLRWIVPVDGLPNIYRADPALDPVLDAFEDVFRAELLHDAFSKFGDATVTKDECHRWSVLWSLENVTNAEAVEMQRRLFGAAANPIRKRGISLIEAACRDLGDNAPELDALRARMAETETGWADPALRPEIADDWRSLQVRQLFRLALEALFQWVVGQLVKSPRSTEWLAQTLISEVVACSGWLPETAAEWLKSFGTEDNPVVEIRNLETALSQHSSVERAIFSALSLALAEANGRGHSWGRVERLPLSRARREAEAWSQLSPQTFIARVLDHWIMSQHTYWSVTRGITDPQGSVRTMIRLRIVMDEGGWTVTPGTTKPGGRPVRTGDRLRTAVSLLRAAKANENGLLFHEE